MGVDYTALADLLKTTRADYGKDAYEVMWNNQQSEFCERLQTSNYTIDGGTSIVRNVMLDNSGQARFVRLFEVEDTTVADVQNQITVPWTQFRNKMAWDVEELKRQKGSEHGFISLFQSRQTDCYWSIADLIEAAGWNGRLDAADTLNPLGIPEALCMMNAGEITPGFKGQTIRYQGGTTGTTFQGLDAATTAKWRNYAFTYTTIDNAFLESLSRACLMTQFKPVRFVPKPGNDNVGQRRLYAGIDTVTKLYRLANAQDDNNVPNDLAGRLRLDANGGVMFNSMPIVYVPALDNKTYSPVYAVDWTKLQMVVPGSEWMSEDDPMRAPSQPSVMVIYVNGQYQQLCLNRRTCGFVGHTVTA